MGIFETDMWEFEFQKYLQKFFKFLSRFWNSNIQDWKNRMITLFLRKRKKFSNFFGIFFLFQIDSFVLTNVFIATAFTKITAWKLDSKIFQIRKSELN